MNAPYGPNKRIAIQTDTCHDVEIRGDADKIKVDTKKSPIQPQVKISAVLI